MTTYRVGFVIEYTLGHVTFAHSLQQAVKRDPEIDARWYFIEPTVGTFPANMAPLRSNYTLRVSAGARRALGSAAGLDAIFLHTQTLALFCGGLMRRTQSVISTDATPKNIDELAAGYDHVRGSPAVELLKQRLTGGVLQRASRVMAWSTWAQQSLVSDYGVVPGRCRVVRPGVDTALWVPGRDKTSPGTVRVLFVGADFGRKGGPDLLAALGALGRAGAGIEVDIVTKAAPSVPEGVRVHRGLVPGDPQLRELYSRADIFVLPTRGDTVGWAIVEAMAAGLPVVSTDVGAIAEVVVQGETGLLVPPGDVGALSGALGRLVGDPTLRTDMGARARERACAEFDLERNGARTLELVKEAARSRDRGALNRASAA